MDERKKWIVFVIATLIVIALTMWGLMVVKEKNTPQAQKIWCQNQ